MVSILDPEQKEGLGVCLPKMYLAFRICSVCGFWMFPSICKYYRSDFVVLLQHFDTFFIICAFSMKISSCCKWLVKALGKHDWMNSMSLLNYNMVENTYQYHRYSNLEPFWFLDSAVIFFVQLPVGPLYHYFSPKCSLIQWFRGRLCPWLLQTWTAAVTPFLAFRFYFFQTRWNTHQDNILEYHFLSCHCHSRTNSEMSPLLLWTQAQTCYHLIFIIYYMQVLYHFPICQMNSNF